MGEPVLRAAQAHEINAVLKFWQEAAENDHRPADTFSAVATLHLRDPDALILAIDGDEIVGTVIAGWDGWRSHLYRLAVAPARRREGIGRVLVTAAEERFRILGAGRVDAMVLDDNEPAHAVWAASGYRQQPEWSRWIKPL
ncbi:MAG TPA: GNAT family N-acetyltransferase [Actinoplanes sp.]|jgi:ribosomal protein S18 acetylase RimI-like enzyme